MERKVPTQSRKLTALPLAAATYFIVSGGPYGLEELVQDSGYKIALAVLMFVPVVWAFPTGLMVGELAASIPAEGGYYVWVTRGMGSFWGFQEAWLSMVSSIFDTAIYPTLFVCTLGQIWRPALQAHNSLLIGASLIIACLLWNFFGARLVGYGSVLLGAVLLSPFVLIVVFAILRHSLHSTPALHSAPHGDLLGGILIAIWNFTGWDSAGTVAGEVENPQKTYPRIIKTTLLAVTVSYIIPIIAVWYQHVPSDAWTTGSWASIGSSIVGPWLGKVIVLTVMISAFGTVNSLTMTYSRVPAAMAEDGYLPKLFLKTTSSGAPWVSILVCGAFWIGALELGFERLVMLEILLDGSSLVLEFIALVCLRIREPQLKRPFKIPGGLTGATLTGVGPIAILAIAVAKNRTERVGSISVLTLGLILVATGVVLCFVADLFRKPVANSSTTM